MNSSKNMIFNSISFIECRLSDELSVGELAGQAFFSKAHYQRLFQSVVGEPVMEYIKKRRLQRAGMMLCETDTSVLEIALQVGYTSHEGFSRAFKEYFGMTPLQYRKHYATVKTKPYHEEVMTMITNEARKNIARYTDDIAKDWEISITELEKWITPAKLEIEKTGHNVGGMKVSFQEWGYLSDRMNSAKNETQKLFAEKTDIYELYDKASVLMKVLDDVTFQMHLLRFLTGVEWSRMGRQHRITFEPILDGLTELCETEGKRKETAVKLVLEINMLIQMEIKREAINCIRQSTEAMREMVKEGTALTEKLNALVIEMGMYGRGFALIAKETEKATSYVRDTELVMQHLADKMDKNDCEVFSADDHNSTNIAIAQLGDNAFKMNVNAFNAAVETARAGERVECADCAEAVRTYAGQLQRTYKMCEILNKDFIRIMALLRDEDKNADISRRFQKQLDDIIFQAGFLNTQLSLESERSNRDDFRSLSHDFQKILDTLRSENQRNEQTDKPEVLKAYHKNLSALIERGDVVAQAAGDHGAGIAYILKEFNLLALRILHN